MMSSNGTDKAVEAVNEEEEEEVTRRAVVVVDALERGVAPPKIELEDCFSSVEVVAAVVVSEVLMEEEVEVVSVDLFFNFNFIRAGRDEAAPIDVVLAVVLAAAPVSPSNPPHRDDDDGVAANLDVNEEEEDDGGGANRPVLTLLANFFVGILRDVFDQAAVPPLLAAVAAVAAAFIRCLPSKFGNSALLSIYGVLPSLDTTNHCASPPLAADMSFAAMD